MMVVSGKQPGAQSAIVPAPAQDAEDASGTGGQRRRDVCITCPAAITSGY